MIFRTMQAVAGLTLLFAINIFAGSSAYGADVSADGKPSLIRVGVAAPDIICLTIQTGRIEYGRQTPYAPDPSDKAEKDLTGKGWVTRKGRLLGSLVGPKDDILKPPDRFFPEKLDTGLVCIPAAYSLTSADDGRFAGGRAPIAAYRKSRPVDAGQTSYWEFRAVVEHTVYLKLSQPMSYGKSYRLRLPPGVLSVDHADFTYDPKAMLSEAVHVSQIGFRPDDPVKAAFLSCWMGDGGALPYKADIPFHVVDAVTGRSVFDGRAKLSKAASAEDEDPYGRNYSLTDVYKMDFSSLRMSGTFKVYVEGVGTSYPFTISRDAWKEAFAISARGFYHQRSGIGLGPPYTDYFRPRAFSPEDGVKVYASTCSLLNSGNGLNALGTDEDNFGNLLKGKTTEEVPNAWGGYYDAGDWDRRIQHLEATRLLLELADLFPDYFAKTGLNIPESGNGLPDIVNEALWNIDFYRRLQTEDGGIRGGIESAEHPLFGEASWQNSLTNYAYAPDPWSSYVYAGVAARAAVWLETRRPDLSRIYRLSSLSAMAWAERALPAATKSALLPHQANDERNLAAIELFRLTGEKKWHDLFIETTALTAPGADLTVWEEHNQRDAAFVYLRTKRSGMDKDAKEACLEAIKREANATVAFGRNTGFNWVKSQPWSPIGWGMLTTPDVVNVLRAHWITGNPTYLKTALLACQFGAGANPLNMAYTTGVGSNSPRHPMVVDARVADQEPPPGITIYGPRDVNNMKDDYMAKMLVEPYCYPELSRWPTVEAYFDIYFYPQICEFTVNQTMGPNAYVWGYLAARK